MAKMGRSDLQYHQLRKHWDMQVQAHNMVSCPTCEHSKGKLRIKASAKNAASNNCNVFYLWWTKNAVALACQQAWTTCYDGAGGLCNLKKQHNKTKIVTLQLKASKTWWYGLEAP
jgi:hypothetical protein